MQRRSSDCARCSGAAPRLEEGLHGARCKALTYLDRQSPTLVRVFDGGRIPLATNLVENAIRPFVVGRKNCVFAGTARGAHASVNLYSVIEIGS